VRRSFELVTGLLVVLEVGLLVLFEERLPQRESREPRALRLARNGVLGGLALAATGLIEAPLVARVACFVARREWGLLSRLKLPPAVRTLASVVLLDYGIYGWHAAMHRVPVLFRLHLVHHVDRDCDVTTALRIHAVEITLSVAFRIVQVVVLGVTPRDFARWQRLFGLSVIFHHANVRLPERVERVLGAVLVTPRRHGIHHRANRAMQHGNWSSGLVLWDWLHGTLRSGDADGDIGVPAYRREVDLTLGSMLALPFVTQPDPWIVR